MTKGLVIGTRGSDLALWQARWVAGRLGGEQAGVRLEIVRTQGDRDLHSNLAESPDKGLFTRELEVLLLDGRIDLAVHSLKDLPTALPDGLALGAVPERAPCGDVLLVHPRAVDESAPVLPVVEGARVGTGSPRRLALLAHARPDLRAPEIFRGNVPTRVRKCVDGDVDAVVLARAGLERLGLSPEPLRCFDLARELWLPAPAQGALGLEVRAHDEAVLERLSVLHCADSAAAVGAERALLARLEAGCHAALGAWARRVDDSGLQLTAGALGADERWHRVELAVSDGYLDAAAHGLETAASEPPRREGWWTVAEPWWS